MVIRGVGEDDGIAEQSRSVVCGVGGWIHSCERDTLARGLLCDRCSLGVAGLTELLGFGFRNILGGWS